MANTTFCTSTRIISVSLPFAGRTAGRWGASRAVPTASISLRVDSSFSCFQTESTPAQSPRTQTVGRQYHFHKGKDMTIKPVRNITACKITRKTFEKIFTEPYYANPTTPFMLNIKSREVLYLPTGRLDQELYKALKKAALILGDTKFYLLLLNEFIGDANWIISFDDDKSFQFIEDKAFPDCAIYSPQGKWGILVYDDLSAVIGGTEEFTKTVFENLPSNRKEKDLGTYLKELKDSEDSLSNPDYSHVTTFLVHMYGDEKATLLINKYSLKKGDQAHSPT